MQLEKKSVVMMEGIGRELPKPFQLVLDEFAGHFLQRGRIPISGQA